MQPISIPHGQPKPTGFFLIALPYTGQPMGDKVSSGNDPLKEAILKDPRSGDETKVEIHNMWRLETGIDGLLIDAWAKLAYGISGPKLINYMSRQYPHVSIQQVEFILCKQL